MLFQLLCGIILGWFIRGFFDLTYPYFSFQYHEWKWKRKGRGQGGGAAEMENGVTVINTNEEG